MSRPRIVIVGGGFGGYAAIKALDGAAADITLIDRRNHHLFQPLLYQVATTALGPSEIAWPIRQLVHRRREVTTLLGNVVDVDATERTVVLENGRTIPYDWLIIATGARHSYFGHDEWEPHAPGLKTLEDATAMRRRLLVAFEKAEFETGAARRRELLTFVIVGAGPTGVELAGSIIDLAHITLRKDFRRIDPGDTRVVLVEATDRVLPGFKPEMSAYARKALTELGVEVKLNAPVTGIDGRGVQFEAEEIRTETVIWAAGVLASPAAEWLGLEADKAGRVKVLSDLSVPGHPGIFVVGDTAAVSRPDGKPVPGIGDAAKQAGRHAARVIRARLAGDGRDMPFHYRHLGDIATIGRSRALIDFGWLKLTGRLGWWVWGFAHIYFLIGLRNRITITLNWLWIYLTGRRGSRIILQDSPAREKQAEAAARSGGA